MQRALFVALGLSLVLALALVATAGADTFGGFSGISPPYLVNQDKVCNPLEVKDKVASGAPACEKAATDAVASLGFKEPLVQRGIKASFVATASGKTLTVSRKSGDVLVTWTAADAIGKIVEVYASQYEDRVAVTYTMRRLGKEVTEVVAFEIVKTSGRSTPLPDPNATKQPDATVPAQPVVVENPEVTKAVAAARKAAKAKALAAWTAVLGKDASHSEAMYRIAVIHAGAKRKAEALETIGKLAASTRGDAIEWLVEARFDKAFAALRSEAAFRTAVGLDRKGATTYERLMGFGGQWEQTGTSCDAPEVRFTAMRDRSVKVRVRSACRGDVMDVSFKGTWRLDGSDVVLTLPTKGKQATAKDEAPCTFAAKGEEDSLTCRLDQDLEFTVLPTRR